VASSASARAGVSRAGIWKIWYKSTHSHTQTRPAATGVFFNAIFTITAAKMMPRT
jgi:hypothetical protein